MTRRTKRGDTDDTLPEQNITSGVVFGLTPYDVPDTCFVLGVMVSPTVCNSS